MTLMHLCNMHIPFMQVCKSYSFIDPLPESGKIFFFPLTALSSSMHARGTTFLAVSTLALQVLV